MASQKKSKWDKYLATDNDFEKKEGLFRYIGQEEIVKIPKIIHGEKIDSYESMFQNYGNYDVNLKVISENKNIKKLENTFQFTSAKTLDLSDFDTTRVENTSGMFYNSYTQAINISNFDISNVSNGQGMFANAYSGKVDMRNIDSSVITDAEYYMWFINFRVEEAYVRNGFEKNRLESTGWFQYTDIIIKG